MTTPPPPTEATGFREAHLRDYWKIVWHSRWVIVATFLVVVGATAIWTFMQEPIYRATAIVEVQPQARNLAAGQDVSGLGAAGYGWLAEEKYHNTQVEVLRSRAVSERVVEKLDLRSHPAFEAAHDPVEALRRRIVVEPRRETGLIEVSIVGTNADEITHWVNEVALAYVERNIDQARANAEEAMSIMQAELEGWQDQLQDAERRRISKLAETELYDKENQEAIVRDKLKTWNAALTQVQIDKNRLEQSLRQIREIESTGAELLSLPELSNDDTLHELMRSRFDLERRVESARVDLLPEHPLYARAVSELEKNEERVRERIAQILQSLQSEYDKLAEHEEYLVRQINRAEGFALQVVQASSDYEIVNTDRDSRKRIFDLMSRAMNEVNVGLQLMTNNVAVLDRATVPTIPIAPRRKLNLFVGGMLGLCLGVAAAFFLDYLDNTFRTPEDVEKYLGLSVLGVVPKMRDDGVGQRAVREAYQSLRTSIIFSSKNRTRKVILVTSTGPQEGKSSTVANVGRALAQAGDRTIVLDCDLRRPTQHLHHKADRQRGLTNYLTAPADETDWKQHVRPATDSPVDLLPCGPIPPNPTELLGSDRFGTLLAEAREEYDWVLIDSPPSSSLADSTLLASQADMVVLVVQHNKTDRDRVRKSLQRLRSVGPAIAGVVLNNVDLQRAYDKDDYYASYYYGTEDGERKRKKLESKRNVG